MIYIYIYMIYIYMIYIYIHYDHSWWISVVNEGSLQQLIHRPSSKRSFFVPFSSVGLVGEPWTTWPESSRQSRRWHCWIPRNDRSSSALRESRWMEPWPSRNRWFSHRKWWSTANCSNVDQAGYPVSKAKLTTERVGFYVRTPQRFDRYIGYPLVN